MSPDNPEKLTLEKLEIHKRLLMIEEYIKEGTVQRSHINDTLSTLNLRATSMELIIHGDPKNYNKIIRDGMNRRIEQLEQNEENSEKTSKNVKENFLRVSIGAITLAVGAFILWLFQLIFKNVGK